MTTPIFKRLAVPEIDALLAQATKLCLLADRRATESRSIDYAIALFKQSHEWNFGAGKASKIAVTIMELDDLDLDEIANTCPHMTAFLVGVTDKETALAFTRGALSVVEGVCRMLVAQAAMRKALLTELA